MFKIGDLTTSMNYLRFIYSIQGTYITYYFKQFKEIKFYRTSVPIDVFINNERLYTDIFREVT